MDGTISCFQSNIQPAWEDARNRDGGEVRLWFTNAEALAVVDTGIFFFFSFLDDGGKKSSHLSTPPLSVWISLLSAAVGETLGSSVNMLFLIIILVRPPTPPHTTTQGRF